jgi:hypothetical protein
MDLLSWYTMDGHESEDHDPHTATSLNDTQSCVTSQSPSKALPTHSDQVELLSLVHHWHYLHVTIPYSCPMALIWTHP